jgi:UDP-N-acetylglucosamine--N-acetylmuramyl-(pentapeptide) pyrophosphoryl-undecaprenol N-acetylglucosamine transferase
MVEQGAAIAIPDVDLGAELVDNILSLLKDETRRNDMTAAAQNLARPDAAQAIGDLLQDLSTK